MIVRALSLDFFRNYLHLEAAFDPGVNVICGDNGHGKTNLLESVFLLTGARSFRSGKDLSLVRRGCDFSIIRSGFFSEGRPQSLRMTISEKGRIASLNQGSEKKAAALAGSFCCVVFSPEHLELIKGSPDSRRRFLDTALCQISPGYLAALKTYTRLLNQRNRLLKDAYSIGAALDMLDIYDEQFAAAASAVTAARRRFVDELRPAAKEGYRLISNGREVLDFQYLSTLYGDQPADPESGLLALRDSRGDDLKSGYSTLGPHRDDLLVSLDGESARLFGSQGQQRSAVLSLKLAESELMYARLGERPVLLLDDVLSELDQNRQDYLIEKVIGSQAIITCCEPELVVRRADARVFRMENGALSAL